MDFATFQDAYLHHLREVFHRPEHQNSPRGFDSRERLGVSFRVTDPVQRHVCLPARRVNPVFNFAEAIWYLSGSNALEQIAYYAPSIRQYSADGQTLAGTAYGPRLFAYGDQRIDQWANALRTLTTDPDSKRSVIQIFDPQELSHPDNIDVACTVALQFLIRGTALHCVAYMRANDAFRGIVSDTFSFTFMQELMARQLGLEVGNYVHCAGSLHVYESDRRRVRAVLAAADAGVGAPHRFPVMPAGDNWPHLRVVGELEEKLRTDTLRLSRPDLQALPLPDYWRQVVVLFELYRQVSHEDAVDPEVAGLLLPGFRTAFAHRWPDALGEVDPASGAPVVTVGSGLPT